MPLPSYKLYAPEASFRAFPILIAAEYNQVSVSVETCDSKVAGSLSPVGKLPVLKIDDNATIFSSHAAARFVAGLRRDGGLLGDSQQAAAAVDAWMDWTAQEVELPACVWFYPVAGYMPFNAASYDKAKTDLAKALKILNDYLLDKTYLVGDAITLADIVAVSTLLYPFKLVADKQYLKPFGNVMRWFQTCVNQPEFVAVMGQTVLCKKELLAPGQEAAGKKQQQPKGGDKKQAKKKEAAAPAPAPKKAEHPYKIMDREQPSPFIMDVWKKIYSNAPNLDEAMTKFWEMYDPKGWTCWLQVYNYNEDNKRIFMTSNAVGGFQQRTDEIRRWAFGVMDVLGTEETALEIKGVWLLRGDSVQHMIKANDDANWYTWTKIDVSTDQGKKLVTDYWCCENELDGKPIQDSKVFK